MRLILACAAVLLALTAAAPAFAQDATPTATPDPTDVCDRGGADAQYADCGTPCSADGADADYTYACACRLTGADADYTYACPEATGGAGQPPPAPTPKRAILPSAARLQTLPLTGGQPQVIALF